MSQELVKYEETIKKLDNYNVIQKWQGDTLIEELREFYQIFVMNDQRKYRINPDDLSKIEELLNNPNQKFIKIQGDLIAIHQITKIEKQIEKVFNKGGY